MNSLVKFTRTPHSFSDVIDRVRGEKGFDSFFNSFFYSTTGM